MALWGLGGWGPQGSGRDKAKEYRAGARHPPDCAAGFVGPRLLVRSAAYTLAPRFYFYWWLINKWFYSGLRAVQIDVIFNHIIFFKVAKKIS